MTNDYVRIEFANPIITLIVNSTKIEFNNNIAKAKMEKKSTYLFFLTEFFFSAFTSNEYCNQMHLYRWLTRLDKVNFFFLFPISIIYERFG